jgi:hypothetical protein
LGARIDGSILLGEFFPFRMLISGKELNDPEVAADREDDLVC